MCLFSLQGFRHHCGLHWVPSRRWNCLQMVELSLWWRCAYMHWSSDEVGARLIICSWFSWIYLLIGVGGSVYCTLGGMNICVIYVTWVVGAYGSLLVGTMCCCYSSGTTRGFKPGKMQGPGRCVRWAIWTLVRVENSTDSKALQSVRLFRLEGCSKSKALNRLKGFSELKALQTQWAKF